jgi:hypothetical protein
VSRPWSAAIRAYLREDNILVDVAVLVLSYAFILFSAWNDDLLGLAPNLATWAGEYLLAAALACEIVLRLLYAEERPWFFYPLIVIDSISVLTVIPGLIYATFSRFIRLLFTGARMLRLIDRLSRKHGNPYLILLVYPLVVPIAAALFYGLERHAPRTEVTNYFQALDLMMSYSLTVGMAGSHPVTNAGRAIAGVMLITGLMCVSIIGNALTHRYSMVRVRQRRNRTDEPPP